MVSGRRRPAFCSASRFGLVALCPACHRVKHLGRSHAEGRGDGAIAQLMAVNGWSIEKTEAYIDLVLDIWKLRSRAPWGLDLSWLAAHGIAIPARRDAPGESRQVDPSRVSQPDCCAGAPCSEHDLARAGALSTSGVIPGRDI
jgi:hypothetical protein